MGINMRRYTPLFFLIALLLLIQVVNAQGTNRFSAGSFTGTCSSGVLSDVDSSFSWNLSAGYERWGVEGSTSSPNTVFLTAGPDQGSVSVSLSPGTVAYYLKNVIHRGDDSGPVVASLHVVWMCTTANGPAQVTSSVRVRGSGSKAGPPAMNLFDGRINDFQDRDVGAEVAIYLGSIKVYAIDPANGSGSLAVDISSEHIKTVGVPKDTNVLLGEGFNTATGYPIAVYRLTTGEFQINTYYHDGKPYVFVWDSLLDHKYHLAW
jgi:hypothetical protein